MRFSNAVSSAIRALAALPRMPPDEIERFTRSVNEGLPMPDASFGADPVWRVVRGASPPVALNSLFNRVQSQFGLVGDGKYIGCRFEDVTVFVQYSTIRTILNNAAHSDLTDAEARLAVQLLQGETLKSAATDDRVGYETKRTHFRTMSEKLQISGQTEVVRVLTNRVVQCLAHLAQPNLHADLDIYTSAFLPAVVRRMSVTSPSGYTVPVLDYGPVNGDPLIVLHPMIFPPIGRPEIEHAEKHGIRLIWPLRNGLLCKSAPMLSAKKHLETSVEGLTTVLEQLVGLPAPVLALVSSGSTATRAAVSHPEMISSISFAATCYSAGREGGSFRYFGTDLAELALRSETIMTRTVLAMRTYAQNENRFRPFVENVFRNSARDLSHLAYEFKSTNGGSRLKSAILNSVESMKQDYFNQTHFKWKELQNLRVPVQFMQGSEDSIHPPTELARLVEGVNGSRLSIAEGMGHLPHREDLLRTIEFAMNLCE